VLKEATTFTERVNPKKRRIYTVGFYEDLKV
jgi:hypothetical protein